MNNAVLRPVLVLALFLAVEAPAVDPRHPAARKMRTSQVRDERSIYWKDDPNERGRVEPGPEQVAARNRLLTEYSQHNFFFGPNFVSVPFQHHIPLNSPTFCSTKDSQSTPTSSYPTPTCDFCSQTSTSTETYEPSYYSTPEYRPDSRFETVEEPNRKNFGVASTSDGNEVHGRESHYSPRHFFLNRGRTHKTAIPYYELNPIYVSPSQSSTPSYPRENVMISMLNEGESARKTLQDKHFSSNVSPKSKTQPKCILIVPNDSCEKLASNGYSRRGQKDMIFTFPDDTVGYLCHRHDSSGSSPIKSTQSQNDRKNNYLARADIYLDEPHFNFLGHEPHIENDNYTSYLNSFKNRNVHKLFKNVHDIFRQRTESHRPYSPESPSHSKSDTAFGPVSTPPSSIMYLSKPDSHILPKDTYITPVMDSPYTPTKTEMPTVLDSNERLTHLTDSLLTDSELENEHPFNVITSKSSRAIFNDTTKYHSPENVPKRLWEPTDLPYDFENLMNSFVKNLTVFKTSTTKNYNHLPKNYPRSKFQKTKSLDSAEHFLDSTKMHSPSLVEETENHTSHTSTESSRPVPRPKVPKNHSI